MDQSSLESSLADLNLGGIRYFSTTGSTNDEAARWVEEGAQDASLLAAGEQTTGRGRAGRSWYSPAGGSLSFSLILYPSQEETRSLPLYSGLGALAVCESLINDLGVPAEIKWPNDVLIEKRKVCGVLAEAHWMGSSLTALILGIGINVAPESANEQAYPAGELHFPAICLEESLSRKVNRVDLLQVVLTRLLQWRRKMNTPMFIESWEKRLAFVGELVQIIPYGYPGYDSEKSNSGGRVDHVKEGRIKGLAPDGSLNLEAEDGELVRIRTGEVHLRPMK